jgi:uncharacterized repeat protein (TIGR02543 family)
VLRGVFMKRTGIILWIALITAIIFSFSVCENGSTSNEENTVEETENPFESSWQGYDPGGGRIRLVVGGSDWTMSWPDDPDKGSLSGTYNYYENRAVIIDPDGYAMGTAAVFEPVMTVILSGYGRFVLARVLTVTFDVNGGSGTVPQPITVKAGLSITLPDGDGFSKTDCTFDGWNTDSSGAGTNYDAGSSYTVTGNITLYAKWNVIYTVTYNVNGGSGTAPAAQTVNEGTSVTLASGSGLSRSGYAFGGWNTNSSGTGTNYNAGSSYTVNGNITFYAKWNINTISVRLERGTGEGYDNWSGLYDVPSSVTGGKITRGDSYTFTYTFKSNVAITGSLTAFLVDNSQTAAVEWWVELSNRETVRTSTPAGTEVSGTITFTVGGTASAAAANANRLCFQVDHASDAASEPTLTFTTLNLTKNGNNAASWYTWGDGITLTDIGNDTIRVNVTQKAGRDTCGVQIRYPGMKYKTFKYVFKAWTSSGTRDMGVLYGYTGSYYPDGTQRITSTEEAYTLYYDTGSEDWQDYYFGFNCGGEIGEFYIKLIAIVS